MFRTIITISIFGVFTILVAGCGNDDTGESDDTDSNADTSTDTDTDADSDTDTDTDSDTDTASDQVVDTETATGGDTETTTGTNLFPNGDFADGKTTGWVIEQQGTATQEHEVLIGEGPEGKNALKVTVLTTGASIYGYEVQVYYPFALETGKTYTFSVWAKTEPAGYEIATVLSQNHEPWGHHTPGADEYPILTSEWVEYGFTWTSTETDPLMRISLGNLAKTANQVFYFADAELIVQ